MGNPRKRLTYRYDAVGNRVGLTDPDGGRFTYAYDTVNRIRLVVNPQGERTSYSYDVAGRRTLKRLANGTRCSFSYDAASRLTKLWNLRNNGTVLSSFDYAYDNGGNRTRMLEGDGSRVTWTYDNTSQLLGEHRTGSHTYRQTFMYDSRGNRTLKNEDGQRTTYAYDAANQLRFSQTSSGRTTYAFDADGNQQRILEPTGDRTTYGWDFENRMTRALLPGGARNTMAYTPDSLRVHLEESAGTKKFVWDDQNYLAETDAANDAQVVYTNEPAGYGNLVSQRRGSTTSWYHFDALGSTRQLTDAPVNITDTRLYDAWGVEIDATGTTVFPFGYVGQSGYYATSSSPLTYVRARYVRSTAARWLSVDPMASTIPKDALTAYVYSLNAPTRLYDPAGLKCVVCKWERYYDGKASPTFAAMDQWFAEPLATRYVNYFWDTEVWPEFLQPILRVKPIPPTGPLCVTFTNTKPVPFSTTPPVTVPNGNWFVHICPFVIRADVCNSNQCLPAIHEDFFVMAKTSADNVWVRGPMQTLDETPLKIGGRLRNPVIPQCRARLLVFDFPLTQSFRTTVESPGAYRAEVTFVSQKITISDRSGSKYSITHKFELGTSGAWARHWRFTPGTSNVGAPTDCC
jgi:RHS repeat-associated protein